jgi:glutamine---fructose-6-phosphate transaminase (isomerizing)
MNGGLTVYKKKGKVSELEAFIADQDVHGHIGMGHTRWATHGEPNDVNAHPHYSSSGNIAIIHNGIIENYAALKTLLLEKGHTFRSETDSEVFINLIEDIQLNSKCSLAEAVRLALHEVVGAYAIVVLSKEDQNQLIAARKGSPLVVGIGEGEYFLASDATPIIEYTNDVVYVNDYELVVIKDGELEIRTKEDVVQTPYVQRLEMALESIEKGGYPHFMLKEIFEQPRSILDSMRGRMIAEKSHLMMGGIREFENKFANAERIIIVACGTSWHAGLVAEYLIEDLARIPVEVEYASEFRYRNPIISERDIVIAISQSGETADTLAALELAKSKGATIFGVCNVVGSSIARATDAGAYTHAGPEIGVASTKAFTAQVTVLSLIAMIIGSRRGTLETTKLHELMVELETIPDKVEEALKLNDQVIKISE